LLMVDRWSGYADAIELPESVRSQVRPYLGYVQTNPAIYMKGTLTLQGYAQMSTSELYIGRVPVPADQVNQYDGVLEYFAQDVSNLYQLHISQLYASGGTLVVRHDPDERDASPADRAAGGHPPDELLGTEPREGHRGIRPRDPRLHSG
jgi:hypothetical protein